MYGKQIRIERKERKGRKKGRKERGKKGEYKYGISMSNVFNCVYSQDVANHPKSVR